MAALDIVGLTAITNGNVALANLFEVQRPAQTTTEKMTGTQALLLFDAAGAAAAAQAASQPLDSDLTAIAALTTPATTITNSAAKTVVITADANANHDLVLTDASPLAYLRMTNAGANTVTIPLNAIIAFPVGAQISGIQAGAGATTIVATGGVTLNCAHTLVARAQYSAWSLIKVASDSWDLFGDLG